VRTANEIRIQMAEITSEKAAVERAKQEAKQALIQSQQEKQREAAVKSITAKQQQVEEKCDVIIGDLLKISPLADLPTKVIKPRAVIEGIKAKTKDLCDSTAKSEAKVIIDQLTSISAAYGKSNFVFPPC
jgi:hypothetical protein